MENRAKPGAARARTAGWLLPLLLAGACTAESIPNKYYDVNAQPETVAQPDRPLSCAASPPLPAPTIDQYPNPTTQLIQPFRGSAPGADLITARGGKEAAQPTSVGSDGRFCIEVALVPDTPNTIAFSATDRRGCPGRETVISITHRPAPSRDGGVAPVLANVAKGAPITSLDAPDSGALSSVNDGDPSSFAKFSFIDWDLSMKCDKFTWIRVDLGKVYAVSELKVRWAANAGGDHATCYALLLSALASPVNPDPAQTGQWFVAKQESAGTAADQQITINPTLARWAALLLYENDTTGLWETFKVAEFEVWGKDPGSTLPPPPDRCN